MPKGSKQSYSGKQKRMAAHIEESVRERGGSEEAAERIGWATVNKKTGGAKKKQCSGKSKSGGTARSSKKASSSSKASSSASKRSAAAKKGWETRRKSSK